MDTLTLRPVEWLLSRPEYVPFCLKPPTPTVAADGSKLYLQPFTFQAELGQDYYNIVKREGDPNLEAFPIENLPPVFQIMRGNTRQNPRFTSLFRSEDDEAVVKTEDGFVPLVKPKYLNISTKVRRLINKKL